MLRTFSEFGMWGLDQKFYRRLKFIRYTSYEITKLVKFSQKCDSRLSKIHEEEYYENEKKLSIIVNLASVGITKSWESSGTGVW